MSEVYRPEIGVQVVAENPIAAKAAASLAEYLDATGGSERRTPLPHQKQVLSDVLQGFADGMHKGYVESPTATGKTYLMSRLADAFYSSGMRVLILCDRRQQADQIIGKSGDTGLIQVTDYMDLRDISPHYEASRAGTTDRVVVSTYASLNKFAASGELGKFQVILADEAHKSLGPVTSANLNRYSPEAIRIGFTATPVYSMEKGVDQVFDSPFHSTTLKEAIESDLVAPVNCLIYATDEEIPLLDDYREDYTQKELERLINLKGRNDKAVEFAKDFVKDGRQGIISCVPGSNLVHARLLAQELDGDFVRLDDGRLKFIRAKAVGTHLSSAENRMILTQFENGQVDVLTFVDLIAEGWNSERASFLIDLQPTASTVKKTQRLGRVIRKKKDGAISLVVDFMDRSLKHQVTSLDVLGARDFIIGRTFRPVTDEQQHIRRFGSTHDSEKIERLLNSSLWLELQRINMVKIADLRLRAVSQELRLKDPLFSEYEQLLAKDPVTKASNPMDIPETAIRELSTYIRRYTREHRIAPDRETIEQYIADKMKP